MYTLESLSPPRRYDYINDYTLMITLNLVHPSVIIHVALNEPVVHKSLAQHGLCFTSGALGLRRM
jgi:hypothetical protein